MAYMAQINKFIVTVDALAFGSWTKVDGLKATYDVKEYVEGGQNAFVHKLPGRMKYENVTLQRAVTDETNAVAAWVASFQGPAIRRSAGQISICDVAGTVVYTWALTGLFPVSWSVNGFDAAGNGIAIETLVLAHDGFLGVGGAVGAAVGGAL
jgi:phage tail-like protein